LHAERPVDTGHEMCGGEKFYSVLTELSPHVPGHLIRSRFVETDLMGNAHDIQAAAEKFHCGSPTAGCYDEFFNIQIPRPRKGHFNNAVGDLICIGVTTHVNSFPFFS
jgi:hypothetical protein